MGVSRGTVEYCQLLDYRRDAASCWQPGLGIR
jgi:hypothetical protein